MAAWVCVHFFKVGAVSELKLNQQRMPGPPWLKILEKNVILLKIARNGSVVLSSFWPTSLPY